MLSKTLTGLLAAGAVVAAVVAMSAARAQMMPPPPERVEMYSDMPKAEPGDDPANWSARRNVVESERYDQLTRTSPAFRAQRIRRECGSISEPDLYQQCVASFY